MSVGQVTQLQMWSLDGVSGASSATFSPDGAYRYELRRTWDQRRRALVFIGLNPSTADASRDDHTIRKVVQFARTWGCGALIMLNLFALRSTDPRGLERVEDPVGPDNDATLARVLSAHATGKLVFGWGAHGLLGGRGALVAEIAKTLHANPECFGLTENGQPKHPLRLAYRHDLEPYRGAA